MNPIRFYTILFLFIFSTNLFASDPPTNNSPDSATELTVQSSVCSQSEATSGLFDNSTAALSTRPTCYTDGYQENPGPVKDIWYRFTVPESRTKIAVQLFEVDPAISWYTKNNDGSYEQVGCALDDLNDEGYLIENLTAHEVIYLQLTTGDHTFGYDDPSGSLAICVWDYEGVTTPANGTPNTATSLTVHASTCEGQAYVSGTLTKASESTQSAPSCVTGDTESYSDVWYKATVPSSGKLTVEMKAGTPIDIGSYSALTAYKKSGETYTSIDCSEAYNDDDIDYPILKLTGRTANEELYFQVTDYYDVRDWTDRYASDFTICAFDPGTLELPQPKIPVLSYYSNPVGNRLSVESPYQIQDLRVFDLMGKEVLHKTPNQQQLTLNTYTLVPGAYLLRVETTEGQQTVKLLKK